MTCSCSKKNKETTNQPTNQEKQTKQRDASKWDLRLCMPRLSPRAEVIISSTSAMSMTDPPKDTAFKMLLYIFFEACHLWDTALGRIPRYSLRQITAESSARLVQANFVCAANQRRHRPDHRIERMQIDTNVQWSILNAFKHVVHNDYFNLRRHISKTMLTLVRASAEAPPSPHFSLQVVPAESFLGP